MVLILFWLFKTKKQPSLCLKLSLKNQNHIILTMPKIDETIRFKEQHMGRIIGYARISTGDQNLQSQVHELNSYNCVHVFFDIASGAKSKRPGLEECLQSLKKGDTLVVWRLDRLGRSLPHLVTIINDLKSRGIGFKSLHDGVIDTTSASGELVFNIFAALSQFERELIRERTKSGLSAARSRGIVGGRKPIRPDNPKVLSAKKLHADKNMKINDICKTLNISRATLYRYVSMPDIG
ncbi:recombinase family protein [Desulfobacter hydrogenophilus]|nr:recombinase family protein [Desulfobacter hydrogenophilus]